MTPATRTRLPDRRWTPSSHCQARRYWPSTLAGHRTPRARTHARTPAAPNSAASARPGRPKDYVRRRGSAVAAAHCREGEMFTWASRPALALFIATWARSCEGVGGTCLALCRPRFRQSTHNTVTRMGSDQPGPDVLPTRPHVARSASTAGSSAWMGHEDKGSFRASKFHRSRTAVVSLRNLAELGAVTRRSDHSHQALPGPWRVTG